MKSSPTSDTLHVYGIRVRAGGQGQLEVSAPKGQLDIGRLDRHGGVHREARAVAWMVILPPSLEAMCHPSRAIPHAKLIRNVGTT